MAADILGPRMHDEVRAPKKRVLQSRRPKCRIDTQIRASRMRSLGVLLDAKSLPRGIERRLEMH